MAAAGPAAAARTVAADLDPRALLQRGRQRRGDAARRRRAWTIPNSRSSPSTTAAATTPPRCSTGSPRRSAPARRPSRREPGQGHGAEHRRAAGQARAAGLHRRRCAARSPGAALDRARFQPRQCRRAGRQSAHPQPHLAAGATAGRRVLVDHRPDPARPDDLWPAVHRVGRDLRLPQACAGRRGLVVAAHHHRRHRRHLARAGGGLARDLRAQRHRLDPDARDTARSVAPAPALGRGRRCR